MIINIPKGTKDILPSESYKWQWLEKRIRDTAAQYGFKEIRTPMFEHTELFARGIGDTTDVVQKEMYTFEIAERSLTLKPEGTAGVVRSYIENKMYADPQPGKYYYIIPCFRYEKMQKGRQRQFHQFGIEIFGTENMMADAEVIALAWNFLTGLGITGLKLHINSIGCPKCRGEYRKALQNFLRPHYDELSETSKGRFEKNPMRILDSKDPDDKKFSEGAPRMIDYLCDECRNAFEDLKTDLDALGIPYEVDPNIVRGLDYYTKTAFEFISDDLGAQSTVCGGGRYDHLVEEVGGPYTPGVGFGMGLERLLLILEAKGIEIPKPSDCDVFIATLGDRAKLEGLKLADSLRAKGSRVLTDVMGRGLKAQLKYADRSGAGYTVVIGDDELDKGVVTLRDMINSTQKEIRIDEIDEEIHR
ncbi:MAG: histidine--tRNA ligase [Firmicutes bacterium]|nr:histidine--tRNA ligase [Bacillota bacterium]MBQ6295670.1 histidine--tRNA ligase [Bacillota bacterium]